MKENNVLNTVKLTIKFLKDRSHKLDIVPALWLLIPNVRNFYNANRKDPIDIYTKPYSRFEEQYLPRKIGRTYVIEWLCFSLYLGLWELTEVGEIYPHGWKAKKRTLKENMDMAAKLNQTGYFND